LKEKRISARIAVIADVHANLPALEAALAAIDDEACDVVYCLGDVIGIGPYPSETLELLLGVPSMRFVMGNHDAWFAFGLPSPRPAWMSDGEEAHHHWTHAQLGPALREVVGRWPFAREDRVGMLEMTFCHYALDETGRDFKSPATPPTGASLDALFAPIHSPIVLYGHDHTLADIAGKARYVNPGSLGCSFDSLARFIVMDVGDDGSHAIEPRAVPYDRADLFRQFEERRVPERSMILSSFFGVGSDSVS